MHSYTRTEIKTAMLHHLTHVTSVRDDLIEKSIQIVEKLSNEKTGFFKPKRINDEEIIRIGMSIKTNETIFLEYENYVNDLIKILGNEDRKDLFFPLTDKELQIVRDYIENPYVS